MPQETPDDIPTALIDLICHMRGPEAPSRLAYLDLAGAMAFLMVSTLADPGDQKAVNAILDMHAQAVRDYLSAAEKAVARTLN